MHKFTTITIIMAAAGCAQGGVVTRYDGDTGGTGTAAVADGYIIGATGSVIVEHVGGAGGATTTGSTTSTVTDDGGAGGATVAEEVAMPPALAASLHGNACEVAPHYLDMCQQKWPESNIAITCEEKITALPNKCHLFHVGYQLCCAL